MKDLLAVISVMGFVVVSILCLMAAKFGDAWATKMMETVVPMVVQVWATNFGFIIFNKYGTSQGSADKSKTIDELLKRLTPVQPNTDSGAESSSRISPSPPSDPDRLS